jgi:hypothetical protein
MALEIEVSGYAPMRRGSGACGAECLEIAVARLRDSAVWEGHRFRVADVDDALGALKRAIFSSDHRHGMACSRLMYS